MHLITHIPLPYLRGSVNAHDEAVVSIESCARTILKLLQRLSQASMFSSVATASWVRLRPICYIVYIVFRGYVDFSNNVPC